MPSMGDRQQAIHNRAYSIWEQEGRRYGNDWAHWFQAEKEIGSTHVELKDIRDAIFISNRAFVFLRNIEAKFVGEKATRTITRWSFIPNWKNGGNTPTKDMLNRVNYAALERPIDLGFEFPELCELEVDHTMIGPKAVMQAGHIEVSVDVLDKIKSGEAYAYIWGWVDYNDVFPGTCRHRSEFCFEIVVHGDVRAEDCQFFFRQHGNHNGVDNECFHKPQPYADQGFYKFLDTADINKVIVEGTLIVSSFEHFRTLEADKWGAIADPLDSASELTARGQFVIREGSSELAIVNSANIGLGMFQKFADVSGGGVIDISGARFIHAIPNLFIYSMAVGGVSELTRAMCVNAERPYNACLRISNLVALRRRIFEAGRIRDLNCKVRDVFEPGIIQAVEYETRSRDIREGGVIEPSPFKKDLRFKSQSEVRFLLMPKEQAQIPKNRLIIEIPDPASLFEEMFRNYESDGAAATVDGG